LRLLRNKEAQAHGRRKESLFGSLPFLIRLFGEARKFWNHFEIVILVGVSFLLG
jgi:hypothetical protein